MYININKKYIFFRLLVNQVNVGNICNTDLKNTNQGYAHRCTKQTSLGTGPLKAKLPTAPLVKGILLVGTWTSHRCPRKDVDSYASTSCDHHPNVSKQHLQHSKKVMNQRQPSRPIRSSSKISPHHTSSPTHAFTFLGSLVSLGATAAMSRFRLPGAHRQLKSFQTFC